ncbi:calcium/sodium antiporter [Nocardioides alcanivorans]|uniref:calcium/sodium antiporter n=1 Tax=Nocardioides alcanivorans TaxID=2897352 RepID=UPI001F49042D|nr:calcium/sodium antiporter [Nocardioides alcanivorans]
MAGGLVALLLGAEWVLRSATSLARRAGVPPMVVGLTIVSVGTSMPELAVGIDAARQGNPGIAVGNIVGTNLVNLLLVLGLCALIMPIALQRLTLRRDLPLMALSALALWVFARDGNLDLRDGVLLCLLALVYTAMVLLGARRSGAGAAEVEVVETPPSKGSASVDVLVLLVGLVVITFGADLLVDGAVRVARSLDVSDTLIGLTVVAIGTSAPELVTALVSTVRGSRDVAIGNLIGSSIYNIALVLGITTIVAPGGLDISDQALDADLFLMLVVALVCVPVFWSGRRISRLEGGLGVALYLGYVAWLIGNQLP